MNPKKSREQQSSHPSSQSSVETAASIRTFYESRRKHDKFEPSWTPSFFQAAFSDETPNKETVTGMRSYLASIERSPHVVTRMLGMRHVQEDGFLVGTTSWIFMGCAESSPVQYGGWVVIDRELSSAIKELERANGLGAGQPTRFFVAHNDDHRVGVSAMTDNAIGPCTNLAQVKAYIDAENASLDAPAGRRPSRIGGPR